MDGGAWWAAVHGVTKSRTWLSDFTLTFHFHALEKEMATHSSVLAWRIPGMGKPGGLPSMGSHRVGHDWSDLAAAAAAGLVCLELIGFKCGLIVSQNTSYWRRQSVKWIRRKRQVIIKVVLNNKILYNRKIMDKRNFPNEKLPLDRNSWG